MSRKNNRPKTARQMAGGGQSRLGSEARSLEALLAERGIAIGHVQAMEVMARLGGSRNRHADERSQVAEQAVATEAGGSAAGVGGWLSLAMKGSRVTAWASSRDGGAKTSFDARAFLAQASIKELDGLTGCAWSDGSGAQAVARFHSKVMEEGSGPVTRVIDDRDTDFECRVDAVAAVGWLFVYRRAHFIQALASRPERMAAALAGMADELSDTVAGMAWTAVTEGNARKTAARRGEVRFVPEDAPVFLSSLSGPVTDDEKAAELRAMMPAPMMDRLDEILAMQADESCYVAEREGQVGILVEREFPSTEGGDHPGLHAREVWGPGFKATEANLFLLLRARFAALAAAHPDIEVYVTGRGSNVRNGCTVLRGFIPVHLATAETVAEACKAICVVDVAAEDERLPLEPRTTPGLPRGYYIGQDHDGDWVLNGPPDVIIFFTPGEGLLIGRCDEAEAMADARMEVGRRQLASAQLARHAGYEVVSRNGAFFWQRISGGKVVEASSRRFDSSDEAWRDPNWEVASVVMGNEGIDTEEWDAMSDETKVKLVQAHL